MESQIQLISHYIESSSIHINETQIPQGTPIQYSIEINISDIIIEDNNSMAQIKLLHSINIGEDFVGGEFIWPAPGYSTITSKFGMRYHPVLKVNNLHKGTDIAMPTGAAIIAANDGVVIKSMYTTGYGNMVMIDHGGGVTTVYGHGSEIVAETGQTVKRGDIIMKAGSTGWSTGPHLHFEIRINGNYVNAVPYITKQSNIEETQESGGEN